MASDISPSAYRGLLIHDERIKTSAITATDDSTAPSDYTQAGPIPGVALSQDSPRSNMTFNVTGEQSANKQLRIKAARGGYPSLDGVGGGLYWYDQGDSDVQAWDCYNVITGFEWIAQIPNLNTTEIGSPTAITLKTNKVLLAYRSALTGNADDVITVKSLVPGGSWTTEATITPAVQHDKLYPALLELPDGTILLFYWVVDTSTSTAQVAVQRSTDSGDTWSVASSFALVDSISTSTYTIAPLHVGYSNGQILMISALVDTSGNNEPVQLASDDNGATFTTVKQWSTAAGNPDTTFPIIFPKQGGGFQVVTNSSSKTRDIGSAYEDLSGVTASSTIGGVAGAQIGFIDEDGVWYMFGAVTGNYYQASVSTDEGGTWARMVYIDEDYNGPYDQDASGNLNFNRDHQTVTFLEGRALLISKFDSAGSSTIDTNSLACTYLGGSSNVTMPSDTDAERGISNRAAMGKVWLPFETPSYSSNVSETKTGTPTESFTTSGYRVQTAASSSSLYWTDNCAWGLGTAKVESPFDVHFAVTVASGGSLSNDNINVAITHGDANERFRVRFNMTTTGFRVVDVNAGSTIGDVTVDMTAGVEVRVGIRSPTGAGNNDGIVRVFYRLIGTKSLTKHTWSVGPTTSTLQTGSGSYAPVLEFGAPNQAATDVTWLLMQARVSVTPALRRGGWAAGKPQFPRPISRFPIGIDNGVKVAAVDGPCYEGEVWNIDTAYQYPVEAIDPAVSPSPARKWRSTDETQHDIVWDVSGLSGADTRLGSTTWALYLAGINFRTGSLSGITHSGSATTLMSFDAAHGKTGLAYTRVGDVIKVNTGTSTDADHYIARNEFAGGTLALDTNKYRRITRHTGGSYTDETTVRPEFFCDTMDGTEDASGTLELWAPRLLIILHNVVREYRWLRLRINAQTTADGYFEIGQALLGPIAIFGKQYSRGRVLSRQPNTTLTTRRNGSRVSRREGGSRRSVQVAWREGVDSYSIFPNPPTTNPVPDYLTGTTTGGAEPIATPFDTAFKMDALVDELNGSDRPVVYLPTVPRGTPDTLHHLHLHESLYGRVVTASRLENVVGDEGMGEVLRIGSVTIEEEL